MLGSGICRQPQIAVTRVTAATFLISKNNFVTGVTDVTGGMAVAEALGQLTKLMPVTMAIRSRRSGIIYLNPSFPTS